MTTSSLVFHTPSIYATALVKNLKKRHKLTDVNIDHTRISAGSITSISCRTEDPLYFPNGVPYIGAVSSNNGSYEYRVCCRLNAANEYIATFHGTFRILFEPTHGIDQTNLKRTINFHKKYTEIGNEINTRTEWPPVGSENLINR